MTEANAIEGVLARRRCLRALSVWAAAMACIAIAAAQDEPSKVIVHWDKVIRVSPTTTTLQVVVNPALRRGTAVHDNAFKALRDLGADYVRYVPWLPYPRLGVAELEAPANGRTFWDFSVIDPMTLDFLEATKGHSVILNFSTIPQWMYRTDKPVDYPADPNRAMWDYEQGTELRDKTMKEVAQYFARLLAWYTHGGFTDEFGSFHASGYHYSIPYWEVLNEVDFEHHMNVESYTRLYDEVVIAMKKVQPDMKFVGLALAIPTEPHYFEYFLDRRNHKPGVPLDFISYHFYATPQDGQTREADQYTCFDQADGFLKTVHYIEAIRKRLSPGTRTTIDELGVIAADDGGQNDPAHVSKPIPNSYWNLSGAVYAYLFGRLAELGIDVVGESQLVGFPTQYPSVSMVDWSDGTPNARYWVLKLLHDSFVPDDTLVESEISGPMDGSVYSLAFATHDGKKRVLLVNKRDRIFDVSVAGVAGGQLEYVDQTTAFKPPGSIRLKEQTFKLQGLSVAVVTFP